MNAARRVSFTRSALSVLPIIQTRPLSARVLLLLLEPESAPAPVASALVQALAAARLRRWRRPRHQLWRL